MKKFWQIKFNSLMISTYLVMGIILVTSSRAEIRLSTDWGSVFDLNGRPRPDSLDEDIKSRDAVKKAADKLDAQFNLNSYFEIEFGYKLFLDQKKFFLHPTLFMAKQRPDEICTPEFHSTPRYFCKEGQRFNVQPHIFIINSNYQEVGYHPILIKEKWPLFCNAVLAAGTGDKKRNELLLTVQYFPIDRKVASKISEIGEGWIRMTVLLRLKIENGRVVIEQDDTCLGNPNRIETIPDARKLLKKCREK